MKIVKILKHIKWSDFEKILRIIEVVAIVMASCVIFQIPSQINEWRNSQASRSMDLLLKMEDKLMQGNDYKISLLVDTNKPILEENKGNFSTDDLDKYLSDLTSTYDAYSKGLISIDSFVDWFSDYYVKVDNNQEIKKYLNNIRKDNPDYFGGIELGVSDINSFKNNK